MKTGDGNDDADRGENVAPRPRRGMVCLGCIEKGHAVLLENLQLAAPEKRQALVPRIITAEKTRSKLTRRWRFLQSPYS